MRWLQCAVLALTFLKMTYFFGIFKEIGQMAALLGKVILDLRYFLLFYAMLVGLFAVFDTILVVTKS